MTHLVCICDDDLAQTLVPHIIIVKRDTLPQYAFRECEPHCPNNVFVIRDGTGWMTTPTCIFALRALAKSVKAWRHSHDVVLFFDVQSNHLDPEVFTEAKRLKIGICIIPAGLTWLVQPCDTHAMRPYKARIRRAWNKVQVQRTQNVISKAEVLRVIFDAIQTSITQQSWKKAFDQDGWGDSDTTLGSKLRKVLTHNVVDFDRTDFCAGDVRLILPKNRCFKSCYMQDWVAERPVHDGEASAAPWVPIVTSSGASSSTGVFDAHPQFSFDMPHASWADRLRPRRASPPHSPPASQAYALTSVASASSSAAPVESQCPSLKQTWRRLPSDPLMLQRLKSAPRTD